MGLLSSIMTRNSHVILIIFFLCFSVHACNARAIRLRDAASAGEFLSFKIRKRIRPTVDSLQSAQSNEYLCCKPKKIKSLREEIKYDSGRSSDVVPFRFVSLGRSISWHVPRKQHPVFYSDYARPHIRPPSHN